MCIYACVYVACVYLLVWLCVHVYMFMHVNVCEYV